MNSPAAARALSTPDPRGALAGATIWCPDGMELPMTIAARIADLNGIITADDLAALGAQSEQVVVWLRQGHLVRARRGAYVDGPLWRSLDARNQERTAARAAVRRLTRVGGLVAAARTAAIIHALPTIGQATTTILARTGGGPSEHAADVRIQACWGPGSAHEVDGVPVLAVAASVISVAATSGVQAGVVAADAALHQKRCSVDDLHDWMTPNIGRRGIRSARETIRLADPQCESPGESLTRLGLVGLELPWRSQVEIATDAGTYRVDFLVGDRIVVEFDGAVKYGGAQGRDELFKEKRREDALRRAGFLVVRVTWADLRDPRRLQALLTPALKAS
ncbi:type IV toxin-antitoxin system AbiEi family antitoxin domain-containing protein [Calidifontibacter indicus]|uniref:type IV toxin-antitoxin system AbiEi family antitoxin domain-containing protein n=1 Tax=Calidifontibacter indicus TaxID=419650 RepID=UPI0011C0305B|nr:type IV toxin-antitoxin system AbiEi family antitoxin domain-containing protein [Calidifontibacter indicus]